MEVSHCRGNDGTTLAMDRKGFVLVKRPPFFEIPTSLLHISFCSPTYLLLKELLYVCRRHVGEGRRFCRGLIEMSKRLK